MELQWLEFLITLIFQLHASTYQQPVDQLRARRKKIPGYKVRVSDPLSHEITTSNIKLKRVLLTFRTYSNLWYSYCPTKNGAPLKIDIFC